MQTYELFQALAEPTRCEIIEMLAIKGELSASDIFKKFEVSAPAISQHLKVLREAKLVHVEKRAQQRIYHINAAAIDDIDEWVSKLKKMWSERYDRLDEVLKQLTINKKK